MNDTQATVEQVPPCGKANDGIDGAEVSLADVLVALGEQKYLVLRFAVIAAVLGIMLSFILPPLYEAKTVIMPPQQSKSNIAASLAGLGNLGGVGDALGVKTPEEMYVGLLQSDSVADELINRFQLSNKFETKFVSTTRQTLAKKVKITSDKKTGFITVTVSDKSPQFAAELANGYFDGLTKLLDRLAVTDAQQRRVFFEHEVEKTLMKLSQAQIEFVNEQRKSGVISLDEQVASTIQTTANLKARVAALEVQLQSMRTYATEENPEVQRVTAEIREMHNQLATLEQGNSGAILGKNQDVSSALANIRSYREVKYEEALLDEFRKQLELAKADEAREGPLVQQIDLAMPPDRRASPRRSFVVAICTLAGLFTGICMVLFRMARDSGGSFAVELKRVTRAWRLRKVVS